MITSLTYTGLFLSSFLAATVLPFSSEVVLAAVLLGGQNPVLCIITATLGNSLGGMSSYGLGYLGKMAWIERYFRVEAERVQRLRKHVTRFGSGLAFLTWFPVIGDPLAIALGFFKVPPVPVAIYMFAGKGLRYIVMAIYTLYIQRAWLNSH